jgi:hypothetical protein
MSMRLRPLLAVTASLTLCLLLLAHPAAAQNSHRGHGGGEPHAMTRERADRSQSTAMAQVPRGLRAPVTTRRDAVSDYGLHASGPLALTPPTGDGARGLAAAQMNGSALNPEPVRAGSLRADIARYNAERAMHGVSTQGRMEVPHPPTAYAPNLYTN